MTPQLSCPRCNQLVECTPGQSPPTHCPQCGQRVSCPRCGSTLHSAPGETTRFECSSCHLNIDGVETVPLTGQGPAASTLPVLVPGLELRGELGRGGMGIVYRAYQASLKRDVAVKVLPPALAASGSALERFRNEAAIAGKLVDAHIVPVFDVQDVQGTSLIIMPLIDGSDLGKIIRDRVALKHDKEPRTTHPWISLDDRRYLDKVLPLLDQVVAAVRALHQGGVLHRDIKPSNILVDAKGNAWLSDFGLARLDQHGLGTQTGSVVGTAAFSSPEQAQGEREVDFRTDLFSLGATIYQALTLELPFGKFGANQTDREPARPSKKQGLISGDFDVVIMMALRREPERRYASAALLAEDWKRARQGLLPHAAEVGAARRMARQLRRHPVGVLCCMAAVLLLGFVAWRPQPEEVGDARVVVLETNPPGAKVVMLPIDDRTGLPLPEKAIRPSERTPITLKGIQPGDYLLVAAIDKERFHEVYRTVPHTTQIQVGSLNHQSWEITARGEVKLRRIEIVAPDPKVIMVRFGGGMFIMGTNYFNTTPKHPHPVPSYFLDQNEVSVGDWIRIRKFLPARLSVAPPPNNHAITDITFHDALDFAELVGKRLPDEAEYEFAATNGGTTRFPWGQDDVVKIWPIGEIGIAKFDHSKSIPPVMGLLSNVAEWTLSWDNPYPGTDPLTALEFDKPEFLEIRRGLRVVRGGSLAVAMGKPDLNKSLERNYVDPRFRHSMARDQSYPGVGFRCARSAEPRFIDP